MAIAFDSPTGTATGGNYNAGPVTSNSWSFVNTAGDLLIAAAFAGNASDIVTGITYNSISMTKITSITVNSTSWISLWYLKSPATGTNTIKTSTSSGTDIETRVMSYSGTNTTTQPDSNNTGSATGNMTMSTTVVASNCWLVSCARNASFGPMTAGTGTTARATTHPTPSAMNAGDSNGTVGTGSQSMQWTDASGISRGCIASIAPPGSAVARLPLLSLTGAGL